MSWNLTGSYFETCSCDVICPCTASLSLGATQDRCKVVLVFNVKRRRGGGHRRERAHRRRGLRYAEGDERGELAPRRRHRRGRHPTSRRRSSAASSRGRSAVRWRRWGRSSARTSASSACRSRCTRTASSTRSGSATRSTSRSRTSSRSGSETGEPAKLTGIFHPAGSELTVSRATRSKINAFGIQYEAKAGLLGLGVRLGGLSAGVLPGVCGGDGIGDHTPRSRRFRA